MSIFIKNCGEESYFWPQQVENYRNDKQNRTTLPQFQRILHFPDVFPVKRVFDGTPQTNDSVDA